MKLDGKSAVLALVVAAWACALYAPPAWAADTASAAPADSLTIDEAVRLAVSGHPSVARAKQDLAAAEERVQTRRAPYYPDVSLTGSYVRLDPVATVDIGKTTFELYPANNYDFHLGLRQILYDFGRTGASVDLARSGRDVAESNVEQARWSLAYRTVSVFNAILILHSNLTVLDEQIMALTRHLDETRKRVEAGTSTSFDALTTEVRIAAVQNDRIDAANALEGQEIVFRELTGLGSQEPVLLKGEFASAPLRLDADSLLGEASRHRPELLAARTTEQSASMQTRLASLGLKPSLTANVTSGFKNGYTPNMNELEANLFAGLEASVPLFDGHRTRGQTREAEANLMSARARTGELQRQIATEVEQALAGADASQQKIKNADLQVLQAEQAVSMAQSRYAAGVATNLDVLDAQTALMQSRLNRLRALYNYTVSLAALDRATGRRLW